MKKRSILFLSLIALVVMSVPMFAFANNFSTPGDYSVMSDEVLAYTDLANAPAELQEKILEERYKIIYSSSWSVDGSGVYIDPDGREEKLPLFSDLFPDWDVPQMDEKTRLESLEMIEEQMMSRTPEFVGWVYLRDPSAAQSTKPFYGFDKGLASYAKLEASSLPGSSFNGGFTNMNTGQDLIYKNNMAVGAVLKLDSLQNNVIYGARASTYSTIGDGLLKVHRF